MTQADQIALKAEFPEILDGNWILDRDHTLEQARQLVLLRRRAFPKTVPLSQRPAVKRTAKRLAAELFKGVK